MNPTTPPPPHASDPSAPDPSAPDPSAPDPPIVGVPSPSARKLLSRRRVLGGIGILSAGAAGVGYFGRGRSTGLPVAGLSNGAGPAAAPATPTSVGRLVPGAIEDRVLVVVDFRGGNDGLSMLAPVGTGRYHDLRPSLAIADEDALWLDDQVALHPALGRLKNRNLITVEGVGPTVNDLSHFSMSERWERGDVDGTFNPHSGFLGRLTDVLDDGSPLVGVSLAGYTNHLTNEQAATLAMAGLDDLWFVERSDWMPVVAYRSGLQSFVGSGERQQLVTQSFGRLLDLADRLSGDDDEPDGELPMLSEGGDIGRQLYTASELIVAGVGTRVIYTAYGDFDTHTGHDYKQQSNMAQFDAALDGFLQRIDAAGASDRVLVATISEFGRRVEENDGGLDHGAASTMMLAGPVADRRAGDRPSLDDLDDDGNLRTTVPFDHYLATLAEEWMGVEAHSVLPESAGPLGILV